MTSFYKQSLALLTDLYQLTMAYAYWKKGMGDKEAAFYLFFRRPPFGGPFAIAAGLQPAVEFIRQFRFDPTDIAYLRGLNLFDEGFFDFLCELRFTCDLDAMPEGTPVFPQEPLLRVQGPLIQAQILESPLLNMINFQSLIATKAARVCWAAKPDFVVEFGMRRAQGVDGALSAARAAYIGGAHATSNVLAAKLYGIPVRGTQAHSWIMAFDEEEEAFVAFAEVMPDHCILLVDTYDTVEGVNRAIRVARTLRAQGKELLGVRLDSGDLAVLSVQIRRMLDEAGFSSVKIMASNELDEKLIADLKHQGARIDIWGVGTHLVTGREQPALDGVYKLAALREAGGEWRYKIKISEQIAKTTTPGLLQVRRYRGESDGYYGDLIYDLSRPPQGEVEAVPWEEPERIRRFSSQQDSQELLIPILRKGKSVYEHPPLEAMRQRTEEQLKLFPSAMRRFVNPQPYFTGLERGLYQAKCSLMEGRR